MNEIRNTVASGNLSGQPSASNMLELVWDDDLAKVAQDRVNTCAFSSGDPTASYRQIKYTATRGIPTHEYSYERGPIIWLDTLKNQGQSSVSSFKSQLETDHQEKLNKTLKSQSNQDSIHEVDGYPGDYSQLVWAKSGRVGRH